MTGDYPSGEISFRLHEAAHRNQEASEAAIRKMQETDEILRQTIQTLPDASEAAIRKMRETDEILRQRIQTLPDWVAGD